MKIVSLKAVPITHSIERPVYLFERPLYHLFVRIETDDGVAGYGEVCDSYACNYPLSVRAIIDEAFKPLLMGEDPLDLERLILKLRGWTRRRLGDQGIGVQAVSGVVIARRLGRRPECAGWTACNHRAGSPATRNTRSGMGLHSAGRR